MKILLPTGAVACVEEPRLRALLASDGSEAALIAAVWTQDMDPERLLPEDRTYLTEWCLAHLANDPEAMALMSDLSAGGGQPGDCLHLQNPVLRFLCNRYLWDAYQNPASEEAEPVHGGSVVFVTPGTEGDR
jgi:hypothetical protein